MNVNYDNSMSDFFLFDNLWLLSQAYRIFTSHKYVGYYICVSLFWLFTVCPFWFKVWWLLYWYHLHKLFLTTEMKKKSHYWRGVLVCLDYSSLWSFPALSKSDVSIPTWNVFGTLITNLTRDLIHCMEMCSMCSICEARKQSEGTADG